MANRTTDPRAASTTSAAAGTYRRRPFVGRSRELALLRGWIAAAVVGEAGSGKTAVLAELAREAARTIWVRGVRSETDLPFAALADLLLPLRGDIGRLPAVQRAALEVALALRPGRPTSPLAVCAGALGVLARAGERTPTLVVVDDFQRVDPPSRQVLAYVARRLPAGRVRMLLAVGEGPRATEVPAGLATLHLDGLTVDDVAALAVALGVAVPAAALAEIVLRTGGNALAVVETLTEPPPRRPPGELSRAASIAGALVALARVDAARGETAMCHERLDRARRVAAEHGVGVDDGIDVRVSAVRGFAELGAGAHAAAARHLVVARAAAERGGMQGPDVVSLAGDLLEALLRAGERQGAVEVLAQIEERAARTGLVAAAVTAARYRGVLARDLEAALECFGRARALHEHCPEPFERARTLLCEGETLRRLRRPAAARPALGEAAGLFDALGARPWAARAERELRAAGAPPTPGETGPGGLTPQEFQIARAVAAGRSNTEAAAALFVSRKTVEAHLTRIYRKLGLRSRTELACSFARLPPGVS